MQLPTTILVAATFYCIWRERNTNSWVGTYQVRSELEQAITLLRTTRLCDAAVKMNTLIDQMFN
jgi:hypothetical protein